MRKIVHTRIATFRPKRAPVDPRPVEVMYNASELVQPPVAVVEPNRRYAVYDAADHQEQHPWL